jgi:TonB family protein
MKYYNIPIKRLRTEPSLAWATLSGAPSRHPTGQTRRPRSARLLLLSAVLHLALAGLLLGVAGPPPHRPAETALTVMLVALPAPTPSPPSPPTLETPATPPDAAPASPARPAVKAPPKARPAPPRPTARRPPAPADPQAVPDLAASPVQPPAPVTLSPGWDNAVATWLSTHRTYPETARRAGDEGEVTVRFRVAADGAVEIVELLRGSGFAALDAAAIATLTNARLPPPLVSQTRTVRLRYRLD